MFQNASVTTDYTYYPTCYIYLDDPTAQYNIELYQHTSESSELSNLIDEHR